MLPLSNKRRNFVRCHNEVREPKEVVLRSSQHYFRLIKAGISDGVRSSTGLYDDVPGDVHMIFNPNYDKLDLADALIRERHGFVEASKLAADGIQSTE